MNSVIEAIVGILMLLGASTVLSSTFYNAVKRETCLKVYHQLHKKHELEDFTRKLTGYHNPY